MRELNDRRVKGTVGDVLDLLAATGRPKISDRVARRIAQLNSVAASEQELDEGVARFAALRDISYSEVIALVKFVEGSTPFATQHSVKGAEFENVVVVLGGGWNQYNWPQLFELLATGAFNERNRKGFLRARNLFYVSVSRPRRRLAVLCTQFLGESAMAAVTGLFGADNVHGISVPHGRD